MDESPNLAKPRHSVLGELCRTTFLRWFRTLDQAQSRMEEPMKNGKAVAIAIAILSLLATSAYGQQLMQADIPFEFHAAGKLIPAGTYVLGGNETFHWLHLRQSDGRTRLFLSGRFAGVPRGSGSPVMIFHRYGERYFLRSVDIPGRNARYTLPASTAEREIAKVTRNTIQVASIRTLSK